MPLELERERDLFPEDKRSTHSPPPARVLRRSEQNSENLEHLQKISVQSPVID
jgi:hypothetical protein